MTHFVAYHISLRGFLDIRENAIVNDYHAAALFDEAEHARFEILRWCRANIDMAASEFVIFQVN